MLIVDDIAKRPQHRASIAIRRR